MKVEVISSCGRSALLVNGFIVAMEGDPCRDPDIACVGDDVHNGWSARPWTDERLEFAASSIRLQSGDWSEVVAAWGGLSECTKVTIMKLIRKEGA